MRRAASLLVLVAVLAGCSDPRGAEVAPAADGGAPEGDVAAEVPPAAPVLVVSVPPEPTSSEWTVVSHLQPRGAMEVAFTVAEPTTCRLAMLVHHLTTGDGSTTKGRHTDLWIDGDYRSIAHSTGSQSNWNDHVAVGPADSRAATNAVLDAYYLAVYGEAASFASGSGLSDVQVEHGGRMVLSGLAYLVDKPQAVNTPDVRGSLMASIECGAPVALTVREDPDAIWTNAAESSGGTAAVQSLAAAAESGGLPFTGRGEATEFLLASWGGVQGSMALRGAWEQDIVFDSLPDAEQATHIYAGPAGTLDLTWETVRVDGNWWMGLSSWQAHAATITPEGNYPF